MTKEDEDYRNNICRFCEKEILSDKFRDHCHLTGKYRGPVHSKCNIKVTQDQSYIILLCFTFLVFMIVIHFSRNWLIKRLIN